MAYDDMFDVILIVVPNGEFEERIRGVLDWQVLANGVDENTAYDLSEKVANQDLDNI
jgi:hypothetical protein